MFRVADTTRNGTQHGTTSKTRAVIHPSPYCCQAKPIDYIPLEVSVKLAVERLR